MGPQVEPFTATLIEARNGVAFMVTSGGTGIPLEVEPGEVMFHVQARYNCEISLFGHLRVLKSSISVLEQVDGRAVPLVRYDFVDKHVAEVPVAHVQFHSDHDRFEALQARAGRGSKRGKRKAREAAEGAGVPAAFRLEKLHFPVGGRRFRPTLEDVLQMLAYEFGIRVEPGAHEAIASSRRHWREIQLRAAIGDAPTVAADEMRAIGYKVRRSRRMRKAPKGAYLTEY